MRAPERGELVDRPVGRSVRTERRLEVDPIHVAAQIGGVCAIGEAVVVGVHQCDGGDDAAQRRQRPQQRAVERIEHDDRIAHGGRARRHRVFRCGIVSGAHDHHRIQAAANASHTRVGPRLPEHRQRGARLAPQHLGRRRIGHVECVQEPPAATHRHVEDCALDGLAGVALFIHRDRAVDEVVARYRAGGRRRRGKANLRKVVAHAPETRQELGRHERPQLRARLAARTIAVDRVQHSVVAAVEDDVADRAAVVDDRRAGMQYVAVDARAHGRRAARAQLVAVVVVAQHPVDDRRYARFRSAAPSIAAVMLAVRCGKSRPTGCSIAPRRCATEARVDIARCAGGRVLGAHDSGQRRPFPRLRRRAVARARWRTDRIRSSRTCSGSSSSSSADGRKKPVSR